MTATLLITSVSDIRKPGASAPYWCMQFTDEANGVNGIHYFPHEVFSCRIAEYGIDPADFDTLLEMVLHELYMGLTHDDPTFLYNTDQATARAAHLKRVSESKQIRRHHDPDNLFDKIRKCHDPNDPLIDDVRRHVQENRRLLKSGRRPTDG